jgi:hypothetical protein
MWLQTFLLTLLIFLVATGVGLLVLAPISKALISRDILTRVQLIALGLILGAPTAGTLLQLLSLCTRNLQIDLGLMLIASSLGWLLTVDLWRPRSSDLNEISIWTALSIPLALITWWCTFGAFSKFPFTDIGADVHWMKIAQEFADSGLLNPYANQTYTDVRSALAGLLAGSLGLDLLQFNWAYRFFSILYLLIVFYGFADTIFLDRHRKWFAFFFAGATNTLGLLTNGSLALVGSALFLAALIRCTAKPPGPVFSKPVLLPAVGSMLVILLAYLLNNNALTLAMVGAIPLAFNVLSRGGRLGDPVAIHTFATVLWSAALIFVHRGSYLFIPAAVAGWVLYHFALNISFSGTSRAFRVARIVTLIMPAIGAFSLGCMLAVRLGYLPKFDANAFFSYITLVFLGTPIWPQDEVSLGAGPEIAAIEVGRALGPFFVVCAGLVFAYWWIVNPPSRLGKFVRASEQRDNVARLLWSWTAGCGLSLVVLSGFPFLYRLIFVISCYFTIAATELFAQLLIDPVAGVQKKQRAAAFATLAIAVLVAATYSIDWSNHPNGGYQAMLRPALFAGAILVLSFAALGLSRFQQMQIVGLAAAVALTVAIDRAGIATIFRFYSYGRLPDQATVISHYDASDLRADRWLRENMPRVIVISDPYTLGMTKAVTGAPGIYLFSNLDTVNPTLASRVKSVISAITDPSPNRSNRALHTCALVSPLLRNLNQEASIQMSRLDSTLGILKPVRRAKREADTDVPERLDFNDANTKSILKKIADASQVLETPQGKWNVVAIINPRTIQWLHLPDLKRPSYFPMHEPLDREVLNRLEAGPFPLLFSDGQNFIILIECDTLSKH